MLCNNESVLGVTSTRLHAADYTSNMQTRIISVAAFGPTNACVSHLVDEASTYMTLDYPAPPPDGGPLYT